MSNVGNATTGNVTCTRASVKSQSVTKVSLRSLSISLIAGRHPDVQEKVQKELDNIFGDDRDRHITKDDLKHMTYLDAVLKESLRIYPSAPIIVRTLTEDLKLDIGTIPKGVQVIYGLLRLA